MIDVLDVLRETLAPRYAVERLIGVGGMARVYLATEQRPHRRVAIKVMDPELSTRLSRERFVREVEVSSRLNHPHIVPVLAADECQIDTDGGGSAGLCYYVMPYVEGESLRQCLLRETRVPLQDALHIAADVADALSYAHDHGVIHRDIKPENILLSGSHALVADFGVARALSAAGGATLTAVGQQIGSPAYMSPEQLAGSGTVDQRSDIYSLGCVLYEMLVGEPPLLDVAESSTRDRRSVDSALRLPGVPSGVAQIVREAVARALAPFPQDRFATAAEFAAFLQAPGHQPRLSGARRPGRRWKVALLTAASALVLGTSSIVLLSKREPALNPRRVVVTILENHTGDPTFEPLGHVAADWIMQGVAQTGLVEVVPSIAALGLSRRGDAQGHDHIDFLQVQAVAEETRAGTVVSGAYLRQGDSIHFQVQITDANGGKVLRAFQPVSAPLAAPLDAVETVRQRVMAALDTLFGQKPR